MGSPDQDFDLLLEAPHPVEAEMARDLLTAAGIPSYLHGRDISIGDLGVAVQHMFTRPNLYVPKGARTLARGVLDEAWENGEPFFPAAARP
jgi:hypothetical protein